MILPPPLFVFPGKFAFICWQDRCPFLTEWSHMHLWLEHLRLLKSLSHFRWDMFILCIESIFDCYSENNKTFWVIFYWSECIAVLRLTHLSSYKVQWLSCMSWAFISSCMRCSELKIMWSCPNLKRQYCFHIVWQKLHVDHVSFPCFPPLPHSSTCFLPENMFLCYFWNACKPRF